MDNKTLEILELIFSRKIILIAGEYGRGKTLVMTALNYYALFFFDRKKFLSNIPFNFKEFDKYVDVKPLVETKLFDDDSNNMKTIITIDEMQRYLDSRDFNKPEIKFIMKWAVDLRKDESQIIGSIQYLDWLEKRANQLLQMIIIPSFVNKYGFNEKHEIAMRLQNKDFLSKWTIIDKKTDRTFHLTVNLYPFINMYETTFKPKPFVINHKEYMDYIKTKWSNNKFMDYISACNEKHVDAVKNWKYTYDEMRE